MKKTGTSQIAENIVDHYKEIIRGIRNVRAEMNVPNSRKATAYVVCEDEQLGSGLAMLSNAAQNMAALNELVLQKRQKVLRTTQYLS